ncbi:ABC transporter substrate-binding protein [Desulforhopalus vacuolatus]|uniref:ABC transporter substrate-binding protein n=1 Tax=Desulforhopalus vacuolatus TaxID=40414 RepID=UPI001963B876|nr:ABC transporter substrate-binding protein [Desulforhopalus vacuolatus]MBM9518889.1 ABC transporter substrate-binding protein [Desulforhopalus vacuolatus]
MICFFVSPAAAAEGKTVRLALQWYPQTQFAGYYMAKKKGFYAANGLNVEILHGDADSNSLDRVISGEAEFGTAFLSTAMQRWSQGAPLVNIAQIVQRSALMLVVRKASGIKTINDLDGARIGTWGDTFQLQPEALFLREKLHVTFVRQSPSFELFMRGGLDATLAMWYNEYHRLIAYGLNPDEMTTFFFSDLNLNQPEDGIYCLDSTLKNAPESAAALVKASVQGWEYAFAHPDETVDSILDIMKKQKVQANRAQQTWMLARMRDIILVGKQSRLTPVLNPVDFDSTQRELLRSGVITTDIPYNDFYKELLR